jgi:hypothetical protein
MSGSFRETKKIKMNDDNDPVSLTGVNEVPFELFADHIFPFVGRGQYRFVGGVCQRFKKAYIRAFPKKTTKYNVSSIRLAQICFDETYLYGSLHCINSRRRRLDYTIALMMIPTRTISTLLQ